MSKNCFSCEHMIISNKDLALVRLTNDKHLEVPMLCSSIKQLEDRGTQYWPETASKDWLSELCYDYKPILEEQS